MPPKKAAPKKAAVKRGRGDATAPTPVKAAKTAATATASRKFRPSVDEHCSFQGQIALDAADSEPWAVKLNQTNIGHNNNKFYIIQLIEGPGGNFACYTRWGRVGEVGQHNTDVGPRAAMEKAFEKKFKDKTKNDWKAVKGNPGAFKKADGKYDLIETDNSDDGAGVVATGKAPSASAPSSVKPSKLPQTLQGVLRVIFDQDMFNAKMKEKNIDANRMPLGKLTKSQVERGYAALEEIEKLVAKAKPTTKDYQEMEALSSRFYTIIPHDFGRMVPPVINNKNMLDSKYELLDMLNDIQIAVAMDEAAGKTKVVENPLDSQYKELGCKLEVVDPASQEFKIIETYTEETKTSGYRKVSIRNVFRVDRPEDKARMGKGHSKEGGRYLLWHGTNVAVVAAILKSGLRIMPHSGGRVGKGLYFASENGKSSGYVGCYQKKGIMFLVETCMGDHIHEITKDDSSLCLAKVKKLGASSVLACGRTEPDPSKNITIKGEWGDIIVPQGKPLAQSQYKNSSFSQSEYLVYEESRARIKYMLEMDFN